MPPDSASHASRITHHTSPLNIWLVTDVFPPGSGGSGWSTYYLGKALADRGHRVSVMRPRYGEAVTRAGRRIVEYGGLPVEEILVPPAPAWAKRVGIAKAWEERTAARLLAHRVTQVAMQGPADIVHGQHMVSAIAASRGVRAARKRGARVVSLATVRDYWPLCPASTRLFTGADGGSFECRECHRLSEYLGCVSRSKRRTPLSYFFAALRWQRTMQAGRALGRCDAVIAVSDYVRGELERSKRVRGGKLVTIPNMIDFASLDHALDGAWPLGDLVSGEPFLLFVGKWEHNKGAQKLPAAVEKSGVRLPVVLAGEGPLRASIAADAVSRGVDFRFYEWLENDAAMLLMRHANALLFPSAWQEPLSRVLLEGCAAGAAIVALETGGTGDVITHGESGWLADDMTSFAEGIRQVVNDAPLNYRLRLGARRHAEDRFASDHVVRRVETLYRRLLA